MGSSNIQFALLTTAATLAASACILGYASWAAAGANAASPVAEARVGHSDAIVADLDGDGRDETISAFARDSGVYIEITDPDGPTTTRFVGAFELDELFLVLTRRDRQPPELGLALALGETLRLVPVGDKDAGYRVGSARTLE